MPKAKKAELPAQAVENLLADVPKEPDVVEPPRLGYWDRLQRVIDTAAMLQRCPIPPDEVSQQLNLMRLGYAEYELRRMLQVIAPQVSVWCGKPDDPLRKGSPTAAEFDPLMTEMVD